MADLMEGADHPTLHQRPKSLNGLRVNRTDDVLSGGVVDAGMGIIGIEGVVARPLVRAEQAAKTAALKELVTTVRDAAEAYQDSDLAVALSKLTETP